MKKEEEDNIIKKHIKLKKIFKYRYYSFFKIDIKINNIIISNTKPFQFNLFIIKN